VRAPQSRPAAALALAIAAALALPLSACSSAESGEPLRVPTNKRPPAKRSHVFVIVMENKRYGDVVGSSSAPYFNRLARQSALLADIAAIRHPSLPNYIALISGDTHGIRSNCTACHVAARSLPDQLEEAGFAWKGYMEDMPRPCYRGASWDGYVKKHNPFIYFDAIRDKPSRCKRIVPYTRLSRDLFKRRLPDLSFITPNLCNDTHDCPVRTGDRFLAHLVPALIRETGPHGFVVITYDEGSTRDACCGGLSRGGRIPTLIAGPDVRRGVRPDAAYTLYSILRTIEDLFGLPALGGAADPSTAPLDAAFESPPRLHRAGASPAP
jgi:hypothetical protein